MLFIDRQDPFLYILQEGFKICIYFKNCKLHLQDLVPPAPSLLHSFKKNKKRVVYQSTNKKTPQIFTHTTIFPSPLPSRKKREKRDQFTASHWPRGTGQPSQSPFTKKSTSSEAQVFRGRNKMGVSINIGTPKWMVYNGKPY